MSRSTCSVPPAGPVSWRVGDRAGKRLGVVVAQTWATARALAMTNYGRGPDELRLEQVASANEKEPPAARKRTKAARGRAPARRTSGEGLRRPGEARVVREHLAAIVDELGAEEVMVLGLLAKRLLEGQTTYGRLHLATDARDLEAERGAELADAAIYHGMLELRRMLRARKDGG